MATPNGITEYKIIVAVVESISRVMWKTRKVNVSKLIDFANFNYKVDCSILDAFMQSNSDISWDQFLEYVRLIETGSPRDEYNICTQVKSLFMQLFDRVTAPERKLRIYTSPEHVKTKVTDIIFEGVSVNEYTVNYEFAATNESALTKFIEKVIKVENFVIMWTYGRLITGQKIKILVVYKDRIMCQYGDSYQQDFMKIPITNEYLKSMNLCEN